MIGLSRGSWHYRHKPRPRLREPIPQRHRAYPCRLDTAVREEISVFIQHGWTEGHSVDHTFATLWSDGIMLGSRRTWWRIAAAIDDQSQRPEAPTRHRTARAAHGESAKAAPPVLEATGPGQVWSWDITDLRSPWRGVAFKAYCIIDIYSRKIVGWRVETDEVADLAVEMFEQAFADHGAPKAVHSDSGASMRSTVLADLLEREGIIKTRNRPRVSNDNPFSESEFKTMKYRPSYPRSFEDVEAARAWVAGYVPWYNRCHQHSGIALFTPDEVHDGGWEQTWQVRDRAHQAYFEAHPQRFRRGRPPHGLTGDAGRDQPARTRT